MGGNFQVSRIPETSKMRVLPHFVIGLTFADNFDPAYFTFSQCENVITTAAVEDHRSSG